MRLHFLGAAQTVTGSAYLLETNKQRFLIDAGLSQGSAHSYELNARALPFHPRHLDGIILTHAHADHSGLIPRLVAEGFRGPIYATPPTIDLCRIILPDAGTIQEEDAKSENKWRRKHGKSLLTPLYTKQQAEHALKYFERLPYLKRTTLGRNIRLTLHDAGHILGSSIVELEVEGSRLVFTGDLGNVNNQLLRNPATLPHADYLITESTYGNRSHGRISDRVAKLKEVVLNARGPVIIPAFAVERTQELLFDLHRLIAQGEIPPLPIYVDSPMAVSATALFEKHPNCLAPEIQAMFRTRSPFEMPNMHFIREAEASARLNKLNEPAIIISASGMCEGGRIRHHLYHHLSQAETTVLFVGYQAERTLGRRIRDGATQVTLFNETIPVRAKVVAIDAYSAHADANGLMDWIGAFEEAPALTFITHGELAASEALAERLAEEHGMISVIPAPGEAYELMPASSSPSTLRLREETA
ncbi:MBL fold metallo-hydrolase [bacterium]|nr:MBL fold metallo-hydrolase [bacterium]